MNSTHCNDNDSNRDGDFFYTNTFETLTFGPSQSNPNPEQQQARPHQVFQQLTAGEPSNRGNYAIGSGIARPKSAPSYHIVGGQIIGENNVFEDIKAKIQAGDDYEDYFLKPSSDGRRKRCHSDTGIVGAESFFETFAFGDDDLIREEVQHKPTTATNTYKRSRSADAANLLPDIEKLLSTGINYDSDDDQNGEIFGGIAHDIEPIQVSFGNNHRRTASEPLNAADFIDDVNFGYPTGQDKPAISVIDTTFDIFGNSTQDTSAQDQKQISSPMNEDIELDGSINSFDSDNDRKPSASTKLKRNNSAPLLSDDFLDTVFDDDKFNDVQETIIQTNVSRDELDIFVGKMMNVEREKRAQAQVATDEKIHRQRRTSHDGVTSSLSSTSNPSRDESLALYNMLISCCVPDQNNTGFPSFAPTGMSQAATQMDPGPAHTDYATSKNSQAGDFILNAAKITRKQLAALYSTVVQSGDTATAKEIEHILQLSASASQLVGSSDLNNAVALMSQAQTEIEALFHRISKQNKSQQSPQDNQNASNIMIINGVPSENTEQKPLDAGSVCPSITGISLPSQPNSSLIAKPSELGSIGTNVYNSKDLSSSSLPPEDATNPEVIMARLQYLMKQTQSSQKELQKWDKKNGLPKSHSQTMVNSSRSRKQLQNGVILKKWNGAPLI